MRVGTHAKEEIVMEKRKKKNKMVTPEASDIFEIAQELPEMFQGVLQHLQKTFVALLIFAIIMEWEKRRENKK